MQELIKVSQNENGKNIVSARELHSFLELDKSNLSKWINQIKDNAFFEENEDFLRLVAKYETPTGGIIEVEDLALSLNCAKKISMMSKSAKGNEVRNYFIECEAKLNKPMNQLQMISFMALQMNEQNERTEQLERKVLEIESKQITKDEKFYTVSGYASLYKLKLDNATALRFGKAAAATSKSQGYPIGKTFDAKYGEINTYHIDILKLTFKN